MGLGHTRMSVRKAVNGRVVAAPELRGQMVRAGDLRNEIGFQNDINILLAALDDGAEVWNLEAPLLSPDRSELACDDGPPTLTELKATQECAVDPVFLETYAA